MSDYIQTYTKHNNIITTADPLLFKSSVMELTLIHITGTEMPADALSRQAHRETKGPIPVAASSIMEALPEAMSDLHWKYEQSDRSSLFFVEFRKSLSIFCD